MSNNFTAVCNLTQNPEDMQMGGRDVVKIRVANNTPGRQAETRFFNAILGGPDVEGARNLRKGDQIVVTGTLQATSYTAKKGKMKGKKVYADEMPFAKLLRVTKSETFFAALGGGDDEAGDSTPPPDAPETSDVDGDDDPLAGL